MKKRVVCAVCGYVTYADKLGDVCPACGAWAKAFRDYTSPVSEKRERWLNFDLHPIVVHFPVAFTVVILALTVLFGLLAPSVPGRLASTIFVLTVCLPFTGIGAIASGLLDGKARFKKVSTPALVKKIVLGSLFVFFGAGMCMLVLASTLQSTAVLIAFLAANMGALICALFLGLIGKGLVTSRTPG